MKALSPNLKINILKNLAKKISPSKLEGSFKQPVATVRKEINPDYSSKKKSILSGKLFSK